MKVASINNKKLVSLVEAGRGKWMTIAEAKALKGKRIYWSHMCNQHDVVYATEVGDIISEWDYALIQECEGYANRQDYWADLYKEQPEKIEQIKRKLLLLDVEGNYTYIYCRVRTEMSDNLPMVCSDDDREVYYTEEISEHYFYYCFETDNNKYCETQADVKINDATGEMIHKYIIVNDDCQLNPKYKQSNCPTIGEMIDNGTGRYVDELLLTSITGIRTPEQAREKALGLGIDIPLEVFERNYNAWKDDHKSQKVWGEYVVYTPCGCNQLAFHISKYVGFSYQQDYIA